MSSQPSQHAAPLKVFEMDLYKLLLDNLRSKFNGLDLKRSGTTFYRSVSYGTAKVSFQKSVSSSFNKVILTADVTLTHAKISLELQKRGLAGFSAYQYLERLGFFRDGRDAWWTIESESEVEPVAEELVTLIRGKVLPRLHELDSETCLVSMWESGISPGLTSSQCDICLAIYYHQHRESEKLLLLSDKIRTGLSAGKGSQMAFNFIQDILK